VIWPGQSLNLARAFTLASFAIRTFTISAALRLAAAAHINGVWSCTFSTTLTFAPASMSILKIGRSPFLMAIINAV
jgi:hypothetical protein